jgi:hypothetical protein
MPPPGPGGYNQQPPQMQQAMAPTPMGGGLDLNAVISRLDLIGKGLEAISGGQGTLTQEFRQLAGNLSQEVSILRGELNSVRIELTLVLTAVHHVYGTVLPQTGMGQQPLDTFRAEMARYAGIQLPQNPR